MLATRSVPGGLTPADVAVPAVSLLTALAVERADTVDPGVGCAVATGAAPGDRLGGSRPPVGGRAGPSSSSAACAAAADGPGRGPSAALLDETAVVVPLPSGPPVKIPLRCLFALSGLGLLDPVGSADRGPGGRHRLLAAAGHPRGCGGPRRRVAALPLLV